ncbi:HupE/UreJ family protein [Ornithinimicrobium cavernae]|uniref:HupE/UreJ family protein n=1 Tax=Ornithinimicrobium cavernae TaxID=2666047 RepID=UPI0013797040|nr:HupE/UreJ family protein [Ornithinimicrobium cavernae]
MVAALTAGLVLLLTTLTGAATAHVRATSGFSYLFEEDGHVAYTLQIDYDALVRAAALGTEALTAPHNEARADRLAEHHPQVLAYLEDRLRLSADGVTCTTVLTGSGVYDETTLPFAELRLRLHCPVDDPRSYTLHYEVFRATDGVVDSHDNTVDYQLGGHEGTVLLTADRPSFSTAGADPWVVGRQLATAGAGHLVTTPSHLLYAVGLALLVVVTAHRGGSGTLRGWVRGTGAATGGFLLGITVAYTVTVLGWSAVPRAVVTPLLVVTVGFVVLDAVLALTGRPERRGGVRALTTGAAGLVHGAALGAAALALTDSLAATGPVAGAWPLVAFWGGATVACLSLVVVPVATLRVLPLPPTRTTGAARTPDRADPSAYRSDLPPAPIHPH